MITARAEAWEKSCQLAEERYGKVLSERNAALAKVTRLEEVLKPFADMHRDDSSLADDHLVLQRGIASDLTMLFERDFRRAAEYLADSGAGGGTGWQPIESAPRDGTLILLARINDGSGTLEQVDCGVWRYDPGTNTPNGYEPAYWYWACDTIEEPTHWAPVPVTPVIKPEAVEAEEQA